MNKHALLAAASLFVFGLYGGTTHAADTQPFYEYARVVSKTLHALEPLEIAAAEAQSPASYEQALTQLKEQVTSSYQQSGQLLSNDSELQELQRSYQDWLSAQLYLTNLTLASLHDELSPQAYDTLYAETEQTLSSLYERWLSEGNAFLSAHHVLPNTDVVYWLYGPATHTHIVQKDDSLPALAQTYRTSISAIKEWNGLDSSSLHKGQVLNLYLDELPEEQATLYISQKGDTLASIAQAHGVPLFLLQEWNNKKENTVSPGEKIKIWKAVPFSS